MTLFVLLLACCLQAPGEITLDADTFVLGDLVPLPSGDSRASVTLGKMPAPGLARRVTRHEIEARLRAAGHGPDGLVFPESILVRRESSPADIHEVTRAVREAFQRRFPDADVELLRVEPPQVSLPPEGVTIDASLPDRFDPANTVFVRLDFRAPGFSRIAYARVEVRLNVLQPVLLADLPANSPISASLLEWRMMPLDGAAVPVDSFTAFEGRLAKRNLQAGQVVRADAFYMPLYVRAGDIVTVRASAANVSVSANMRARAAGSLGDTVGVEHLAGGGTITARIIGPKLLEVIAK